MVTAAHETDAYHRYSVMRVGALRALCKEKGLPSDGEGGAPIGPGSYLSPGNLWIHTVSVSGRKEDLVNRLCNNCSTAYSGLINARVASSSTTGSSPGSTTSKSPTDVTITEGVPSEEGITTPHAPPSAASSGEVSCPPTACSPGKAPLIARAMGARITAA